MEAEKGSLNFIGALALYQHRRDTAIGLTHITQAQRGLLWYYDKKQRDAANKFVKADAYHAIIQLGAFEIKRLVGEAQQNPGKAREILKQVRQLEVKVKKARKELRVLNGG